MCPCICGGHVFTYAARHRRGNGFSTASRPREEKRKAIKAPWQEAVLKIKFVVSVKLELKNLGGSCLVLGVWLDRGSLSQDAARLGRTSLARVPGVLGLDSFVCNLGVTLRKFLFPFGP